MKKLLYLALAALLFSCSDNDDETNYTVKTATFENTDHVKAGPTAEGENLYFGYNNKEINPYSQYKDITTNLVFSYVTKEESGFNGFVLSNWNNKEINDYPNQCSVFYGDNNQKNGGYLNSENFLVAYMNTYLAPNVEFYFEKDNEERVISHFYINNTTYTALTLKNGNGLSAAATYENKDFFKLIMEAFDASGNSKGTKDIYLADFTEKGKPGILTEWLKVDTQQFGKIHKLTFTMEASDNLKNEWGITVPAYFCIDNVTIINEN